MGTPASQLTMPDSGTEQCKLGARVLGICAAVMGKYGFLGGNALINTVVDTLDIRKYGSSKNAVAKLTVDVIGDAFLLTAMIGAIIYDKTYPGYSGIACILFMLGSALTGAAHNSLTNLENCVAPPSAQQNPLQGTTQEGSLMRLMRMC